MALTTDPPAPCKVGPCGYHCNCYNDIDWDFPGCQWCQLLTQEKKRDGQIAELHLEVEALKKALGLARDQERARCIGKIEEIRNYHSKTNPLNTDVTFILDRAIDEVR